MLRTGVSRIAAHHANVFHQKRKILLELWVKFFLHCVCRCKLRVGASEQHSPFAPTEAGPRLGGARTWTRQNLEALSALLLGPRFRGDERRAWGPLWQNETNV